MNISKGETRTKDQIVEHYKIEKELAARLMSASKVERKNLYSKLYDELFTRVRHHPQLTRKVSASLKQQVIIAQVGLLSSFFSQEKTFMEIGPGDCALSIELSKFFKKVYAIDVSKEITMSMEWPDNFELIISDGTSIDLNPGTVDIGYSNQLIEHLHPDDALEQLQNIYETLVPGGMYICLTPHRYMGPADISGYFDEEATGFHLKEYTNRELYSFLKSVGFKTVKAFFGVKGRHSIIPVCPVLIFEDLIKYLPHALRKKVSRAPLIRKFLTIQLIASK